MTIPSGPSFGRGAGAASTSFWTISHTFRNISQRDATPRAPDDRGRRTSWILIGVAIRCCDRFRSFGLTRFIIDNPAAFGPGARVLDLAAGCGIASIAATFQGATAVANEIDPLACAAVTLNAELNGAAIATETSQHYFGAISHAFISHALL